MKESKFIELLNLYIDQQISPEEAARLEEEIVANSRRRRTYQQYCRMHRACTLVFENYRTQMDRPADSDERPDDVFETVPRRRFRHWGQFAAAAAAVACLSFVGTRLYLHSAAQAVAASAGSGPSAPSVTASPVSMAAAPAVAPMRADRFVAQRLYFASPLGRDGGASLVFTSAPGRATAAPGVERIDSRPTIEQFVFRTDASMPSDGRMLLRSSTRTVDGQEEMAAYQFQR